MTYALCLAMLTSIAIDNYRCFEHFELDLTAQRTLLVGSNGAGKSALWQVLKSLQDVVVRGVDVETAFPTTALTRLRAPLFPLQTISASVSSGAQTLKYTLIIEHQLAPQSAAIHTEMLTSTGPGPERRVYAIENGQVWLYGEGSTNPTHSFPTAGKRSFLSDINGQAAASVDIAAFRMAIEELSLLALQPASVLPTAETEDRALHRTGSNFASWLRGPDVASGLPRIHAFGPKLVELLEPSMPGLRRIDFKPISNQASILMLTFESSAVGPYQAREYEVSLGELSDGQRALLVLYGFLLDVERRRRVVFIDEPELNLAPHEIRPWLARLWEALDISGGRALVISHHPAVIDEVAPSRTVQIYRPSGGRALTREVTLETTGGMLVSEWLSRPWAYAEDP